MRFRRSSRSIVEKHVITEEHNNKENMKDLSLGGEKCTKNRAEIRLGIARVYIQ